MEENLRVAPDDNYFNRCHNYVFAVQSQSYLLKTGLYLYIDPLQIGFDTSTQEIILPINEGNHQNSNSYLYWLSYGL